MFLYYDYKYWFIIYNIWTAKIFIKINDVDNEDKTSIIDDIMSEDEETKEDEFVSE